LNVSVFNSLVPVLIVAAAALFFRDRITPLQGVGIAISLTGVLVIVTRLEAGALAALRFNFGDLIILFNMACWAIYSVFLRRAPKIHLLSFTVVLAGGSTIATLPVAMWEHVSGFTIQPTALTIFAIL